MTGFRVIDSHAHIFPWLGSACGFKDPRLHRLYLQKVAVGHVQPIRRAGTDEEAGDDGVPWDPAQPGLSGYQEVRFRVSSFGRFTWTKRGASYYLQYMPPWLETQKVSAELLIAMMDHAGIHVAVLQNDHIYGDLNAYFADAVRRFPQRFIGTIQVDEVKADAEDQIARLYEGTQAGLRGLFYKPYTFFRVDFGEAFDAPRFAPFWSSVEQLRLPTYWDLAPIPSNRAEDYLAQLNKLAAWAERYPEIPCLFVQAMPTRLFFHDGRLDVPPLLGRLCRDRGILLELTLPIVWGRWYEYPFVEAAPIVQALYDHVGRERLVWGSDSPNVERYCTYRQSWQYLARSCPFLGTEDLQAILVDNLRRFFASER